MSSYRCGLQISRRNVITDEIHDQPREKVIACLIDHDIFGIKESHIASDIVSKEAINQLELDRETKADVREQEGEGALDILRNLPVRAAASKIASYIPKETLAKAAGAAIGTALVAKAANYFNKGSSDTARDVNPGEKHAIIKLPNGKYGIANYQGPGTDIVKRIKEGDPPRTETDVESMAHDIRYALSTGQLDVREADEIYVDKMKQLQREGLDSSVNIQPALRAIQAKMTAEDYSMLSRDAFIDTGKRPSRRDKEMLTNSLDILEQLGYGKDSMGRSSLSHVSRLPDPTLPKSVSQRMRGGFSVESKGLRTEGNQRGNPEVDTWRTMSLSERVHVPLINAMGRFQDRAFKTTLKQSDMPNYRPNVADKVMRGGAQAPGRPAPASSQKIKVSTASGGYVRDPLKMRGKGMGELALAAALPLGGMAAAIAHAAKERRKRKQKQKGGQLIPAAMALGAIGGLPLLAKGVEKLRRSGKLGKKQQKAALMGKGHPFNPVVSGRNQSGRGYRSSNIVDIGTPGYASKTSSMAGLGFPADRLLKKMQKKLKKHYAKNLDSKHSPPIGGRKLKKPLFMDDYELSHMMADKLAPMVMAY